MPENRTTNSQTLVINAEGFEFEPLNEANGYISVLKFKLDNPNIFPGDVLLILAGSEIQFHGLIGKIEDGYAIASDPRGSQLPARIH
ncbi:MAG: hypothetical protein KF868_11950 [Acidobacteria bacterium]|nr:hypothetical protein [Acidobacteriota bacterium]MCW5967422.1 hypothetical protein [Blastocatellales bacterium]